MLVLKRNNKEPVVLERQWRWRNWWIFIRTSHWSTPAL